MSDQTIGTVRVYQINTPVSPRVTSINSGITTLKGAADVDVRGAEDGEVLVYKADTDSFVLESISAATPSLDAGTF
jgi:hypothetical protein